MQQLEQGSCDRAGVDRLLGVITSHAQKEEVDFDSARQLAWAFTTLKMEIDTRDHQPKEKRSYNVFVQQRYPDLNRLLKLALPEGQQPIAGKFTGETMKQVRDYEPKDFRKLLR